MSEAQLLRLNPIIVNLEVAKGLPRPDDLDTARYTATVDKWAKRIRKQLDREESTGAAALEPSYRHDPDLWRAGSMAVILSNPPYNIAYTAERVDAGDPSQMFVHGVIDRCRGTCASMPVLYLAIAHRLGWPLKAVVSGDHMWVRWDDGKPPEQGGKRFNLEVTSTRPDGRGGGSFLSMTDEQIAEALGTSAEDIKSGSDFTSLTARQTLGVYMQSRAGYWASHDNWPRAAADIEIAHSLFPQNRDIAEFVREARERLAPHQIAPPDLGTPWGAEPWRANAPSPARNSLQRRRRQSCRNNRSLNQKGISFGGES